jgi:hypothetical protein
LPDHPGDHEPFREIIERARESRASDDGGGLEV